PFAYDLGKAADLPIRVEAAGLSLDALAKQVPQFNGKVAGSVSGFLKLILGHDTLRIEDGNLELGASSPGYLSYDAGGWLGGVPAAGNSKYRLAEQALKDLTLPRFRLELFPDGESNLPIRISFFGESEV